MSYQVLARKWRPKKFQEVIGQDHVTKSLQNAIQQKKIAHAYLFTGTRGVGKTTIARIFAKAIRCENIDKDFNPCLQCQSCLDIEAQNSMDYLEIDGASNNSVDNIRNLIENVAYLPARGAFKIYVIDEVHMLSVSAFNALLKTLEEPPAHVIFMFATTDPHKLLGTVLSRVQRFDFKSVSNTILEKHINYIASQESIVFSPPTVAAQLAELGQGSVRDCLSLLDQVLSLAIDKKITDEIFSLSLGLVGQKILNSLLLSVLDENPSDVHHIYSNIISQNIDLGKFNQQLLNSIYKIIQAMDETNSDHQRLYDQYPPVKNISFAEMFWIFESYTKDIDWAMRSPSPMITIDLLLQKLARRRQILKPDAAHIKVTSSRSAPLIDSSQKKSEILDKAPIVKDIKPHRFDSFLEYLADEAPLIKGQLERGFSQGEPQLLNNKLILTYTFDVSHKDALEYLESSEVFKKFKNLFAQFYEVGSEMIEVKWNLISVEDKIKLGKLSYNDKFESKMKSDEEAKKNQILNDKYILEAEKLFNSKIDKIVLKTE